MPLNCSVCLPLFLSFTPLSPSTSLLDLPRFLCPARTRRRLCNWFHSFHVGLAHFSHICLHATAAGIVRHVVCGMRFFCNLWLPHLIHRQNPAKVSKHNWVSNVMHDFLAQTREFVFAKFKYFLLAYGVKKPKRPVSISSNDASFTQHSNIIYGILINSILTVRKQKL